AAVPSRGLDVSPQVQHAGPGLGAHGREQAEAHVSLLLEALPRCRGSRTGGDSALAPPPGQQARPRLDGGAVARAVSPPGQLIDLQREEHMVYDIRIEDVEYVRHGDKPLLARLFKPRGSGPFPLVVELHGGAWCRGDRLNDTAINEPLAKSGVVVAALDFRMPPEAPYPASLTDINYAIRWLKTRATALGSRVQARERREQVALPPVLYIQGTRDQAHPRADLDRFVARYRAAGGEVELELFEGEAEGFVVRNPTSPAATRAAEKIVE